MRLYGNAFLYSWEESNMKLFNSMTNQKEEFVPLHEGKVSMYVCGPTVYNHAHIGNARPMIVFDLLNRLLEYRGYEVTFVSNYTDVDDKIIAKAIEEGVSEKEVADRYIAAYEKVREGLNVKQPTYTPRVTQTMDRIIDFICHLVDQGSAYVVDGDVYFRVSQIANYGCLSGIRIEDLLDGASNRVDNMDKKESPLDFALWKKTDEGIRWDSPWGKGRPGWHTECVVMINDLFENGKIDIHGGGQDLKFPHHENEIAQSMAFNHHQIANYWMHNQMINIDKEKMSKSLGNVKWAKDLIEELGTNVLRWLMLSTHYRNPLNYTQENVEVVKKEVTKVERAIMQASLVIQTSNGKLDALFDRLKVDHMADILEDDLNSSSALTCLLEEAKVLNTLCRQKDKDLSAIEISFATLLKMVDILGFVFTYPKLTKEDLDVYEKWQHAKGEKNFELADTYRQQLQAKGIL